MKKIAGFRRLPQDAASAERGRDAKKSAYSLTL